MMRLFVMCSSVFLMLASAGLGFADEHFPFQGEIGRGPVNVRAGANTNYEVVDKLAKGDTVIVLGRNYEWYKIQMTTGGAAYVRQDYLQVQDKRAGEVIGNRVNVRAKPNSESSTMGQLVKGELVTVLDGVNGWWKIEPPPSTVGWIHADFVKVKNVNVPVGAMRKTTVNPLAAKAQVNEQVAQAAPAVPAATVAVSVKGRVVPMSPSMPDARYQLIVNGKPTYCLKDAPNLEKFDGAIVDIDGKIVSTDHAYDSPLLRIDKISYIL